MSNIKKVFTDRSRIETYQRCKRARWLEYHEGTEQRGVVGVSKPLPLAVGGSVHEGLAVLLRAAMINSQSSTVEDAAVSVALEDFSQFSGALEVEMEEAADLAVMQGLSADETLQAIAIENAARGRKLFDQFLFEEQSALVEAQVRAYARRRLKPLLEQFEILEVEREGQWLLSEGWLDRSDQWHESQIWFMSRPDSLLLERSSQELYLLSFKTAAKWDIRKERDAQRDMQGLSEGVEIEKRLGEWWNMIKKGEMYGRIHHFNCSNRMYEYLDSLPAPPRIMGIRYEYILKGDRKVDKDLSAEMCITARVQHSPLVRGYWNRGMTIVDEMWNVSWDYIKEGGETSKLYWKNWKGEPVWKHMPVKQWIDWLDQTVETVGEDGRAVGWSSTAQSTGFLENHPLDEVFIPPVMVYRNDDDLRDWVEQVEAQEREVAEHAEDIYGLENTTKLLGAADHEGQKRSLLNIYFPQTRKACEYPSTCQFVKICFGGAEIRRDPVASGNYKVREPNHPQELVKIISKST